jgi:hypothetical protein
MGITLINGIAITASLATTATTASLVTVISDGSTSAPCPILFVQNSGSVDARVNPNITYGVLANRLNVTNISSSGTIIAASFTGSLLGTASFAVSSSRAISSSYAIFANAAFSSSFVTIEAIGTNALHYPTFVDTLSSPQFQKIYNDTGLTYNPSTNELRANLLNIQNSGSNSSTADANLTIDASLTQSMYWVASFTATRSLVVNNLTQGRSVRVYIRNTNATQRQIIFSGSTTTSGHGLTNMAVNAGAASVTTQNIVANNGTMIATMENMGGFIVGGLM